MKRITVIALSTLLVLVLAGPAAAGPNDVVNLGTAQIDRSDLAQLKSMVAGTYRAPAAVAATSEPAADLGVVEMPRRELDRLQAMVAGSYIAPVGPVLAAHEEMVDVGKVAMPRSDYESLKRLVAKRLHEVVLTASAVGAERP